MNAYRVTLVHCGEVRYYGNEPEANLAMRDLSCDGYHVRLHPVPMPRDSAGLARLLENEAQYAAGINVRR